MLLVSVISLEEDNWDDLIELIRAKSCTPFIGAGACYPLLEAAADIANRWAQKYDFPFKDSTDLAKVAQYISTVRYLSKPKNLIAQMFRNKMPDFKQYDEPHALLADLELPLYITTNYDNFMFEALRDRKKDPAREVCPWYINKINQNPKKNPALRISPDDVISDSSSEPENNRSPEKPLVYHLHGHLGILESMVLTENDYLDFLIRLTDKNLRLVSPEIEEALSSTALLFLGYSFSDVNFRVLFRSLTKRFAGIGYLTIAVQLPPSTVNKGKKKQALEYIEKYLRAIKNMPDVFVYWGDIRLFTRELRDRMKRQVTPTLIS